MFSESMLNNMTGYELAHYVKMGSIDSLSSELVIKIVEDYDYRIECLTGEIEELEDEAYSRSYGCD